MTDTDSEATADEDTVPLGDRIDFRRVASVATTILVIAAAVPFVIYAFPGLVGAQSSFVVLSGSMEPTMSPGDVIVIEDVEAENIEQGDVITYGTSADRPTTHRVIEVQQEGGQPAFRTAGDANNAPDSGVVGPSEVQGRVPTVGGSLFVIPYVGHVILFASTQFGFALLFATPLVLFVGTEVRSLVSASGASGDVATDADTETSEAEAADADDGDDPLDRDLPDGVEPAIVPLDGAASADADDGGTDDAFDRDLPDGVEPAIVPLDETSDDEDAESEADEADEDDAAVTMTTAELSLGLTVLGGFFAYSVWVSYATVEIWAMTVTGATGTAFAMLSALYVFGGSEADADAAEADEAEESGDDTGDDGDAASDDALPVSDLPEPEALFEDAALEDSFEGAVWVGPETSFEADEWPDAEDWDDAEFDSRDEIVFGGDAGSMEGMNDD